MSNRNQDGALQRGKTADPHTLSCTITEFLKSCGKPAALDYGDVPFAFEKGCYALESRAGKLMLEMWDEKRSLARRILSIERASAGILDCTIQRFGGKTGSFSLLDLDRPQTAARFQRGVRQSFAGRFGQMLWRQFPGWDIHTVTASSDLRRSFSGLFPRAHLSHGRRHMAALACGSAEEESGLVTAALLWYEHLLARRTKGEQLALCLFLPEGAGALTAHRLRWLGGRNLVVRLFRFNDHGMAGEVDAQDLGNIETRVASSYAAAELTPEIAAVLNDIAGVEGVGVCPEAGGGMSIRFRGLEFARIENGKFLLGIESKGEVRAEKAEQILAFARQLNELQSVPSFPERWMESAVRSNLEAIDPDLLPAFVHGQVLTLAAGEREMIDLLAITPAGQLAILELKASEDLQLPIQALDYWIRIGWHAERGELAALFPGIAIAPRPPRLMLVAPALGFHSANEIVLRHFSPEIDVERIGVNSDWERNLKVVFRLQGAAVPISHQRSK